MWAWDPERPNVLTDTVNNVDFGRADDSQRVGDDGTVFTSAHGVWEVETRKLITHLTKKSITASCWPTRTARPRWRSASASTSRAASTARPLSALPVARGAPASRDGVALASAVHAQDVPRVLRR